ncbi:STAS domain-containing protein [Rhizobiales bacterium L72]|uniref:STAS domain-containing protein n=2 Tax=Propylenella binzhouense TaxID=2555902 RepID=A0A964T772_9HYPH|nr:STAS domain-containing protein [Propylenella binzhouense]
MAAAGAFRRPPAWHLFVPKLVTILRQGYGAAEFRVDAIAGLTVAIVALPLAMALAIASGSTPDKGLVTVVVAGVLISALGGSRVQIGGPTGAFVVVVFNVIQAHGYDGLVLATLMAGLMLVVAGLARLGTWIKYIPEPVVTGFTAGIAVIIFTSQVKDLLGLEMASVPAEFLEKWPAFWEARASISPTTLAVSFGALALILAMRRWAPRWPAFLVAVTVASVAAWALGLELDTIGSVFGGIPSTLPAPQFPEMSLERVTTLLPSAFTIAFLAGVESLLSAVVADGMTGGRHRSNCELVAEGVANTASALFGGLPATGAIARTATNIRSGARSPVAGILHAGFVLLFMLVAAPLAAYVPLASLAAVLVIVAWNMSEIDKFRHLLSAPIGDRLVLLLTFGLTVLVDLTFAIEVGVVLAAILFMHRMAEVVTVQHGASPIEEDVDDFARTSAPSDQRADLPQGVDVFQLRGPLFFGAAGRLIELLDRGWQHPRVFIVRMREVPFVDTSGVGALRDFVKRCKAMGTKVIVTGVQPQPRQILTQMGFGPGQGDLLFAADLGEAVEKARTLAAR